MLLNKRKRGRPRNEQRQKEWEEREQFRLYNDNLARERERRTDPEFIAIIGELTPGIDAANLFDALIAALRFAKAYRLDSPVIVGETSLLDLERRIFYEAGRTKQPCLCQDGTLSELIVETILTEPFDLAWIPLAGADEPISQEPLDAALLFIKVRGEKQWN